jgi:hypothetical protein
LFAIKRVPARIAHN